MRILILGGSGQVGRELVSRAQRSDHELLSPPRSELDIAEAGALSAFCREHHPEICLNAAAYTNVAGAEEKPDVAFRANCEGAAQAADVSEAMGIPLIHVSTDYVFDGFATRPYREEDPTSPVNAYGASKLAGELEVRQRCGEHLIIRTSWVFSRWRRNFVKTICERALIERELQVVDDEIGSPTSAADLAGAILQLANLHGSPGALPRGVYHCSNRGSASRFELAEHIVQRLSKHVGEGGIARIQPISTRGQAAGLVRPAYSVLDTGRIQRKLRVRLRCWREAADEVIDALMASSLTGNSP